MAAGAFTSVQNGQPVVAPNVQQLIDEWMATTEAVGVPFRQIKVNDTTESSAYFRNLGGGPAVTIYNSGGDPILIANDDGVQILGATRYFTPEANGGADDGWVSASGQMTYSVPSADGNKVLTVPGMTFTAADIGKAVSVSSADTGGATLTTTITGLGSSGNQCILARGCQLSPAGNGSLLVICGTDNKAAIEAAWADACAYGKGGTVKLRGPYAFGLGLTLTNGLGVAVEGCDSTPTVGDFSSGFWNLRGTVLLALGNIANHAIDFGGNNYCTLRNIMLNNASLEMSSAKAGIFCVAKSGTSCENISFENVFVSGKFDAGVYIGHGMSIIRANRLVAYTSRAAKYGCVLTATNVLAFAPNEQSYTMNGAATAADPGSGYATTGDFSFFGNCEFHEQSPAQDTLSVDEDSTGPETAGATVHSRAYPLLLDCIERVSLHTGHSTTTNYFCRIADADPTYPTRQLTIEGWSIGSPYCKGVILIDTATVPKEITLRQCQFYVRSDSGARHLISSSSGGGTTAAIVGLRIEQCRNKHTCASFLAFSNASAAVRLTASYIEAMGLGATINGGIDAKTVIVNHGTISAGSGGGTISAQKLGANGWQFPSHLRDGNDAVWIGQSAAASAVNYIQIVSAASGSSPGIAVVGAGSNLSLLITPKGTGGVEIVSAGTNSGYLKPAAYASGSPNANSLYQQNIVKGWAVFSSMGSSPPTLDGGFNVAAPPITRHGTGDYSVSWDTDFANTNYACFGLAQGNTSTYYVHIADTSLAAGVTRFQVRDATGTVQDPNRLHVMAIGLQ